MPSELTIEDDGFAKVTLGGVTVEIDLYRVYNDLGAIGAAVSEEFAGEGKEVARQDAYIRRAREFLVKLGFTGRMSDRAVDGFDDALFRAVSDLGKTPAEEPTLDSHDSSALMS